MLARLIPNAISLALINVSRSNGLEPFKLQSYKVNVNEGKWLKKDNLALEKFNSVVIASFAQDLIFFETKSGNRTGNY